MRPPMSELRRRLDLSCAELSKLGWVCDDPSSYRPGEPFRAEIGRGPWIGCPGAVSMRFSCFPAERRAGISFENGFMFVELEAALTMLNAAAKAVFMMGERADG